MDEGLLGDGQINY